MATRDGRQSTGIANLDNGHGNQGKKRCTSRCPSRCPSEEGWRRIQFGTMKMVFVIWNVANQGSCRGRGVRIPLRSPGISWKCVLQHISGYCRWQQRQRTPEGFVRKETRRCQKMQGFGGLYLVIGEKRLRNPILELLKSTEHSPQRLLKSTGASVICLYLEQYAFGLADRT
jgi:hypothetical protein